MTCCTGLHFELHCLPKDKAIKTKIKHDPVLDMKPLNEQKRLINCHLVMEDMKCHFVNYR